MIEKQISVFISYSHDSENHRSNVLSLSDRLITEGIDCEIDRYVEGKSPEKGWAVWMEEKLRVSDYVLVVCSENYLKRCEGREMEGSGLGVIFESVLFLERLYENGFVNRKFIPVFFDEKDSQFIPTPLKPFTRYNVKMERDYNLLYRRITNQIEIVKPALGKIIILPTAINLKDVELNYPKKSKKVHFNNASNKSRKDDLSDINLKKSKDILITNASEMKLDSQFIMIEDQADLAQSFVKHLNISRLVNQVAYISDLATLNSFILDTNHKRVFWVDINLGVGRENEGLDMIKLIRTHAPKSLIIVYSAYAEAKEKCMEIGVENFFVKAEGSYENTINQIREKINAFLQNEE